MPLQPDFPEQGAVGAVEQGPVGEDVVGPRQPEGNESLEPALGHLVDHPGAQIDPE